MLGVHHCKVHKHFKGQRTPTFTASHIPSGIIVKILPVTVSSHTVAPKFWYSHTATLPGFSWLPCCVSRYETRPYSPSPFSWMPLNKLLTQSTWAHPSMPHFWSLSLYALLSRKICSNKDLGMLVLQQHKTAVAGIAHCQNATRIPYAKGKPLQWS